MLKAPGLVDLLLENVDLKEGLTYKEDVKLWVLPAGVKTRNPADLIASDRMKVLMEACRRTFDMVVLDAPPIGPVINSVIISELVDKVVYIVRWASTPRELVQEFVQRLPRDKLAGTVFNRVNEKAAQKYGKYASGYYYGARAYKKYYSG